MFTHKSNFKENLFCKNDYNFCEIKKYKNQEMLNPPINLAKYWVNVFLYNNTKLKSSNRILSRIKIFDLYEQNKLLIEFFSRSFIIEQNNNGEYINILCETNQYSDYSKKYEINFKNILDKTIIYGEYSINLYNKPLISSSIVYEIKIYVNVF